MECPKIYLLSIGINKYKSGEIHNLEGCLKDVNGLQEKLALLFDIPANRRKIVCDEAATRKGIISAFRSHFQPMQDGDIAVFHFSGHGSWESTHAAFISGGEEPAGGRNETLVCHDSHYPGIYNIADKELRYLVSEIQQSAKHSQFVGIFDCCHSGSILRGNCKSRIAQACTLPRPLAAYLEGQYERMLAVCHQIKLPSINYIALTACAYRECAFENAKGGFFTSALIDLLNMDQAVSLLSYAEVHFLSRAIVQQKSNNRQNPGIEFLGSFNVYGSFLKGIADNRSHLPLLSCQDGQWEVNIGLIHGVDPSLIEAMKYPIYLKNDFSQVLGTASIKEVLLETTVFIPNWEKAAPEAYQLLNISFLGKRLPIRMILTEDVDHSWSTCEEWWQNPFLQSHLLRYENANYELLIDNKGVSIYHGTEKKMILLVGLFSRANTSVIQDWLVGQLRTIVKWENLRNLCPPKYSLILPTQIAFYFSYWDQTRTKRTFQIGDETEGPEFVQEITIPLDDEKAIIYYEIEVKHFYPRLHGLYFSLLHLDRTYQISQKNEHFVKPLQRKQAFVLYNSKSTGKGLSIQDSSVAEANDIFLLIASTSPLTNLFAIQQPGFKDNFGKMIFEKDLCQTKTVIDSELAMKANWMVKRLNVRLVDSG